MRISFPLGFPALLTRGLLALLLTTAAVLGLPYVLIPTNFGVFDFTLRNAILSRYPFLETEEIGSHDYLDSIGSVGTGGGTAKDVTRVMPAVVIDVPGASQPATVITLHAKSSTGLGDRFRRAVDFARIEQHLSINSLDANDNTSTIASDHFAIFADFTLGTDANEYLFTGVAQTIVESFDAITGAADPLNWTSSPAESWLGTDDGTTAVSGKHAYGTSEYALGSLTATSTTFTAHYRNTTGAPVTAMRIAYDAEQWGVVTSGSADTWTTALVIDGTPTVPCTRPAQLAFRHRGVGNGDHRFGESLAIRCPRAPSGIPAHSLLSQSPV